MELCKELDKDLQGMQLLIEAEKTKRKVEEFIDLILDPSLDEEHPGYIPESKCSLFNYLSKSLEGFNAYIEIVQNNMKEKGKE